MEISLRKLGRLHPQKSSGGRHTPEGEPRLQHDLCGQEEPSLGWLGRVKVARSLVLVSFQPVTEVNLK